jgi:hypothetical protein
LSLPGVLVRDNDLKIALKITHGKNLGRTVKKTSERADWCFSCLNLVILTPGKKVKDMKALHKLLLTTLSVPFAIVLLARNICKENPWIGSTCKTVMVVFSIVIAILSAILWHISASWQEQLTQAHTLSPEYFASITSAAAMLNTKAALLSVVAALMNGAYFWLGTARNSPKDS